MALSQSGIKVKPHCSVCGADDCELQEVRTEGCLVVPLHDFICEECCLDCYNWHGSLCCEETIWPRLGDNLRQEMPVPGRADV